MADKTKEKKHLLVVTQYFYPETFRINDICLEWVKRGYKVTVVTGIPNYPGGRFFDGYGYRRKRREMWNGIEIYRLPLIPRGHSSMGLIANYLSFMISGVVAGKLKHISADIVFSFEVSPMTQVLAGISFAHSLKVPHLLYVQDLWPESITNATGITNPLVIRPVNRMVDRIYRKVDRIFTTSRSFVDAICDRKVSVPRDKVVYWPQYAEDYYVPVDRSTACDVAEGYGIPKDGFKIIFTGNVGVAQGLDILPEIAQKLDDDRIRFVIVGEGRHLDDLNALIDRLGVRKSFIMVPRQPGTIIPTLLAACDVAFISLLDEKTLPAKLQSYMACGMPVLAVAQGEIEQAVREAECGICCHRDDQDSILAAIRKLSGEDDIDLQGKNSRRYYLEHFDKKLLLDEMDSYIELGDKS